MRYKLCANFVKIAQGIRPCGAFIFHISVKSGEIWQGGGTFGPPLHAKFHPHRCNVSPLRGEKPQNRPLSKLNTGRFALRAMLPVIKDKQWAKVVIVIHTINDECL